MGQNRKRRKNATESGQDRSKTKDIIHADRRMRQKRNGEEKTNQYRQAEKMEQIIGIGMDAIEINRVVNAYQKDGFQKKYYTEEEQALISVKKSRAATNFAGKEAVAKALGTGFYGIAPNEIAILRKENGAPYVTLSGGARKAADTLGVRRVLISLSDTKEMAFAYAVCLGTAI